MVPDLQCQCNHRHSILYYEYVIHAIYYYVYNILYYVYKCSNRQQQIHFVVALCFPPSEILMVLPVCTQVSRSIKCQYLFSGFNGILKFLEP